MDIGSKIRELRTEKLMTQSELAGTEITRNMLSQIENGVALPSLGTVMYLAKRLGVSAGYLLADENDYFIYKKNSLMKNIKKAYTDKSFEICRDLCLCELEQTDDETEMILSYCAINLASENICDGKLHTAIEEIDRAIRHSDNTMYDTLSVRNRAYVMLKFLKNISPTLYSSEICEEISDRCYTACTFDNLLCKYIISLDDLDNNCFDSSDSCEKLYAMHIDARKKMMNAEYANASAILKDIMNSEEILSKILLYLCSSDMEICCREIGDFRGAYEYSKNKIALLEYMLSDN